MSLTYQLDGFDLHQPNIGFRLLEESTFASEVSPRRVNIEVPRVHGEIPSWNDPLTPKLLTLNVEVRGDTHVELEERWNHLRALCRLGGNRPVTIQRVSDFTTVSVFGQLQNMSEAVFHHPRHLAQATMLFHIPYGRWEDVNASEQQMAIPGMDQNLVFAAESTAPVSTVLVRAEGPLSSLTINDNTNETGFQWAGDDPIPAGEYLRVDCAQFQAWHNTSSDWDAEGDDVSRWLATLGNGMLNPVPLVTFTIGGNTNSTTVQASGTSGMTDLHIRGRRTYV